ncbi:Protein kinase, partial [Spiromyces aspiralis]
MLCGRLPFDDDHIPALFKKISSGVFSMPNYLSDNVKSLLSGMLVVDPLKRMTIAHVRQHPWFVENLPDYLKPLPDNIDLEHIQTIDYQIVGELERKLEKSPNEILDALKGRGTNSIKVSYQLLLDNKHMLEQSKRSNREGIQDFALATSPPAWNANIEVGMHKLAERMRGNHHDGKDAKGSSESQRPDMDVDFSDSDAGYEDDEESGIAVLSSSLPQSSLLEAQMMKMRLRNPPQTPYTGDHQAAYTPRTPRTAIQEYNRRSLSQHHPRGIEEPASAPPTRQYYDNNDSNSSSNDNNTATTGGDQRFSELSRLRSVSQTSDMKQSVSSPRGTAVDSPPSVPQTLPLSHTSQDSGPRSLAMSNLGQQFRQQQQQQQQKKDQENTDNETQAEDDGGRRVSAAPAPAGDMQQSHPSMASRLVDEAAKLPQRQASVLKKKPRTRPRWHFGIRSRSPPADVMAEVFRALKQIGMQWKILNPYHIRARYVYPKTSPSLSGQEVKIDLQLYRLDSRNYL